MNKSIILALKDEINSKIKHNDYSASILTINDGPNLSKTISICYCPVNQFKIVATRSKTTIRLRDETVIAVICMSGDVIEFVTPRLTTRKNIQDPLCVQTITERVIKVVEGHRRRRILCVVANTGMQVLSVVSVAVVFYVLVLKFWFAQ